MDINISQLIGQPEGLNLEYKPVLPPARTLGQIIAAFANAEGGKIVLGVRDNNGTIQITGLSEDFNAQSILAKALNLLSPIPTTEHKYTLHEGKKLFLISVLPSKDLVQIEGKIYRRFKDQNILSNPTSNNFNVKTYTRIFEIDTKLKDAQINCTGALSKFIDHYSSVINIVADLSKLLYPISAETKTESNEGKILFRILFSSCADNFETYLSDLLYEIYLANPRTLKSGSTITVKEVLDCNDIQEFINYYAKKKLSKLQRGSVKGFINDNEQISSLDAITKDQQDELERILQIRHLYAHKNGVVDEKFLSYFPEHFVLNETHEMTLDDFLNYLNYLAKTVKTIDTAALRTHNLATI